MTTLAPIETAGTAVSYLGKNASSFDSRSTLKVLRNLPLIRQKLDATGLASLLLHTFEAEYAQAVISALSLPQPASHTAPTSAPTPEVDAFVHVLAQAWAIHNGVDAAAVAAFSSRALRRLEQYNRRSLDHVVAKIWFYYLLVAERAEQLHSEELYAHMMASLRTAALRHDGETLAMLETLLLRLLVTTNRLSTATSLVSKTQFPDAQASNALAARYYYYLARLNAIELDYGTALEQITVAIRKAPQTPQAAGFLQTAQKLSVLVELLTGDIPERKAFGSQEQPELLGPLQPYLALARAVRAGDVQLFEQALEQHAGALRRDGNLTLARRLRQNVIKTGIRAISLTYSKISLKDVCVKLSLGSEESAEYIVSKAVRDGVIDAKINHQQGFMQSLELSNVYSTAEPQQQFHERIQFCMGMHDDNVKALRYLNTNDSEEMRDLQEAREREKELVTEIQETSDLDDEDVDFEF